MPRERTRLDPLQAAARRELIKTAFGSKIADLRLERRMSVDELARAVGVPPATIHRIERGLSDPRLAVVLRLCQTLNVTVEQAVAGIQTPRPGGAT